MKPYSSKVSGKICLIQHQGRKSEGEDKVTFFMICSEYVVESYLRSKFQKEPADTAATVISSLHFY
jgi:hypothetical protein